MKRYCLIQGKARGGVFYAHDQVTGKRESLKTMVEADAKQIINAKNEALRPIQALPTFSPALPLIRMCSPLCGEFPAAPPRFPQKARCKSKKKAPPQKARATSRGPGGMPPPPGPGGGLLKPLPPPRSAV